MKTAVVVFVRCFMAEKIAVSSGIKPGLVGAAVMLTYSKSNSTVRVSLPDLPYQFAEPVSCKKRVFSPLQHEGSETEFVALFAAGEDRGLI